MVPILYGQFTYAEALAICERIDEGLASDGRPILGGLLARYEPKTGRCFVVRALGSQMEIMLHYETPHGGCLG